MSLAEKKTKIFYTKKVQGWIFAKIRPCTFSIAATEKYY